MMFAWLLLFTALAQIAMPLLMYVIAPGFADDPEKFDLSVALTRIAFPYLLFMSLTALQSGRAQQPAPFRGRGMRAHPAQPGDDRDLAVRALHGLGRQRRDGLCVGLGRVRRGRRAVPAAV